MDEKTIREVSQNLRKGNEVLFKQVVNGTIPVRKTDLVPELAQERYHTYMRERQGINAVVAANMPRKVFSLGGTKTQEAREILSRLGEYADGFVKSVPWGLD